VSKTKQAARDLASPHGLVRSPPTSSSSHGLAGQPCCDHTQDHWHALRRHDDVLLLVLVLNAAILFIVGYRLPTRPSDVCVPPFLRHDERQNTKTNSPPPLHSHFTNTGRARGAGGRGARRKRRGESSSRFCCSGGQATRRQARFACRLLGSRRKKEGGDAGAYTGLAGTQLRVVPHLSEESERTQRLLLPRSAGIHRRRWRAFLVVVLLPLANNPSSSSLSLHHHHGASTDQPSEQRPAL